MVSLDSMHKTLLELFVDRTEIDTSLARYMTNDGIAESLKYKRCMALNDEDKLNFIQSLPNKQYYNEKCDEKYNMFIPSGDVK